MKKLVVQNLLKVWLCAMVSFMTVTLYAQGNSFKVSGTVKDNTGELRDVALCYSTLEDYELGGVFVDSRRYIRRTSRN